MIGGSFGSRIGRARSIWRLLRKPDHFGAPVNLVRRYVQKAERGPELRLARRGKIGTSGFQQLEGADDVGMDEGAGTVDGAIDVRFGGEIDQPSRAVALDHGGHGSAVSNVGTDKIKPPVAGHILQALHTAGVGQLVDHHHPVFTLSKRAPNEVRSDEAGTAGNDNRVHRSFFLSNTAPRSQPGRAETRRGEGLVSVSPRLRVSTTTG